MTLIVTGTVEQHVMTMIAVSAVEIAMEVVAVALVEAEESAFHGSETIFKGK